MIKNISNSDMVKLLDTQKAQPNSDEKQRSIAQQEVIVHGDKVSLNFKSTEAVTYGISKNGELLGSGYKTLQDMVAGILEEQGIITRIDTEDDSIDIRDITPEKAQELIADDGYWGVEQTSDRIVQFAISISGNDPDRLDKIIESIDEGFQMASEALGGALPDISTKTYDAVMDKLNAWAEGSDISESPDKQKISSQ